MYANIQGLSSRKLNQIEADFNNHEFNFICMSETWASSESLKEEFCFSNFNLRSHFSRSLHNRGGVALFARSSLKVNPLILDQYCNEINFEICGAIWKVNNLNIVILVCYRSPDGNFPYFLNILLY